LAPASAAQEPGSCLLNRTSNFANKIKIFRFPASELVKITDALHLAVFF
jgi:hypothetical protein